MTASMPRERLCVPAKYLRSTKESLLLMSLWKLADACPLMVTLMSALNCIVAAHVASRETPKLSYLLS